jgi:nitroimidazol reductase NimA-like FMN-containing flavoprotein (pyridoxamine 5'-phosphate oxidase superfamily)
MSVVTLPARAIRLADRSIRRAVANAGEATSALVDRNNDRRRLSQSMTGDGEVPGGLVRLSRAESLELLRSRCIGRYAFVESARALSVVPVNYVLTAENVVLFASGPGPKLSSAERGDVVAFEVDDIDSDALCVGSVHVVGRPRRLTGLERDELVERPVPWATGPRQQIVAIKPSRIEGRRLC